VRYFVSPRRAAAKEGDIKMSNCPGVHTGFGWNPFNRQIRREGDILRREEERLGMQPPGMFPGSPELGPSDAAFAPQNADPFAQMFQPPPPAYFDPYMQQQPQPPAPPPPPGIQQEILSSELARGQYPYPPQPLPGFPQQGVLGAFDRIRHEEHFRRPW